MSLHLYLLAVITTLVIFASAQECDVEVNGRCFFFRNGLLNWRGANTACREAGGSLAAIMSQEEQEELEQAMRRKNVTKLWLGSRRVTTDWTWIKDGSHLQLQGCFHNNVTEISDPMRMLSESITPDACVDRCKSEGYRYAGVQSTGGTIACHCGKVNNWSGQTSGCYEPCKKRRGLRCGGEAKQMVYRTDGDRVDLWYFNQPNNYGDRGQNCLAAIVGNHYKWGDEKCDNSYYYICQYDTQQSECASLGYIYNASVCFQMVQERKPWFMARRACEGRNGYLLAMNTDELHRVIEQKAMASGEEMKWWLGASNRHWIWNEEAEMSFTAWSPSSPDKGGDNCLLMDERGWMEEACDDSHPYLCQATCSPVQCRMNCEHGFQKDSNGCDICRCNPPPLGPSERSERDDPICPPITCDLGCKHGLQKDDKNCSICSCVPAPACPSLSTCHRFCEEGFQKDDRNCSICRCVAAPTCPSIICHLFCEDALEQDDKNCTLCKCVSPLSGTWENWSECFPACGVGVRTRRRNCDGGDCEDGPTMEADICLNNMCTDWVEWGEWSECSEKCDRSGTKRRRRNCTSQDQCSGTDTEIVDCWGGPCKQIRDEWNPWSVCHPPCGVGVKSRTRDCPTCEGEPLAGREICNNPACTEWAAWNAWGRCSEVCDRTGSKNRTRVCSSVQECSHSDREVVNCWQGPCP